ncbi:MAG: hypothetical protein ACM36C_01305 [Acidobacteriota bacterium]
MTDTFLDMIWFFERYQARLSYEIRRATEGTEFELVITQPDGSQQIEAFTDASLLIERSVRLRDALASQGWRVPDRRGRYLGRIAG